MPNEPLLNQLTQLTEGYTQRQKRAAALQAAFKFVTDAHSKTSRFLRDYADQDTTVDVARPGRLRPGAPQGRDHRPLLPDLRREIKTLATLIAALKESATALRAEPVDVVRLDKALTALQPSKEQAVLDPSPTCRANLTWPSARWATSSARSCGRRWLHWASRSAAGRPSSSSAASSWTPTSPAASASCATARIWWRPTCPSPSTPPQGLPGRVQGDPGPQRRTVPPGWRNSTTPIDRATQAQRPRRAHQHRGCLPRTGAAAPGAGLCQRAEQTHLYRLHPRPVHLRFLRVHRPPAAGVQGTGRQGARLHQSQTDSPAKSMWIVEGDSPYDGHYISDVEFVKVCKRKSKDQRMLPEPRLAPPDCRNARPVGHATLQGRELLQRRQRVAAQRHRHPLSRLLPGRRRRGLQAGGGRLRLRQVPLSLLRSRPRLAAQLRRQQGGSQPQGKPL